MRADDLTCARCGTAKGDIARSDALGQDVCRRCYLKYAPARVHGPWDAALADLARHEQAQERKRAKQKGPPIDTLAACERIAQQADNLGRQAIVDPVLHVVLMGCPACHAEQLDVRGIHLPFKVIPRADATVFRCGACGYERTDQRHGEARR